ncbi:MAG: NADP-dependent oxidoreductase [Proteobacteria bacterium]|nr:NADP-dependent oxidoreductase [Pseudomonadota bacterium]
MSTIPAQMFAIAMNEFGDENVLETQRMETPSPKSDEVLVKISHTSVNPVDWKIRRGYLQQMLPHRFPIISGWDASGVVVKVGASVTSIKIGDRVAAYTRLPEVHSGTYAEYIALPESFVAKVSERVSSEAAAGVPLVALTAFQGLQDYYKVGKGDHVLILNGAGGVGSFAIQFAKQLGATVTTTTSGKNFDYVKSLGADHAIDYTKESLTSAAKKIAPHGFDFVFDGIGGTHLEEAFQVMKKSAHLISIVDNPNQDLAKSKDINAQFHFVYPNGEQLKSIFESIDKGKIKMPAFEVLSVKDAIKAQQMSESHRTKGKIILRIDF